MQFKTFAAAVLIGWSSFAVAETPQNAPGPEREYSGSSSQPAIPAAGKDMILETYVRVFVEASAIDRTIAFYRTLLSGEQTMRFDYPETGLVVAAVSAPRLSVLIIAGSPKIGHGSKRRG